MLSNPKTQSLKPKPSASLFLCFSVLILLLATLFSTLALGNARRFHPDEAFYMTFARNAAVNGDWWLISEPVDKPPLTFYANALSLVFLAVESDENGVLQLDPLKGEFAGRIPSMLMSVILVAVVMALAKSVYYPPPKNDSKKIKPQSHKEHKVGVQHVEPEKQAKQYPKKIQIADAIHHAPTGQQNRMIYLAGLLATLTPFRIVFAATAFTDLPMLLFATISLWMAARGKWFWSGFWFIVSFWAKPQSVFYLPLVLLFPLFYHGRARRPSPTQLWLFFMPIVIGGLLLWGWDMARIGQGAESFFVLGQRRYTATMITPLADYPARLAEWWAAVQYLFGHGILTVMFLTIGIIEAIRRKHIVSLILVGWIVAFSSAHIILTLNLFDRNQIVLMPVAVILVALGFQTQRNRETEPFRRGWSKTIPYIVFFLLSWVFLSGIQASFQQLPIGGDDGRHDGIHELADYLNSKPVATVIYDPWLDWELDYYMGIWTDKRRVFYPTPELLLRDALALEEVGKRYFVVPSTIDESLWLTILHQEGFTLVLDYETPNFRVWELSPAIFPT